MCVGQLFLIFLPPKHLVLENQTHQKGQDNVLYLCSYLTPGSAHMLVSMVAACWPCDQLPLPSCHPHCASQLGTLLQAEGYWPPWPWTSSVKGHSDIFPSAGLVVGGV
jgi:hypothetical protein